MHCSILPRGNPGCWVEAKATACYACSPGEDPRISITARFASSLEVQDRLDHIRLGKRSGGVLSASGPEISQCSLHGSARVTLPLMH